ncbi:MAG: hypothetical protein WA063_06165 [Minisyncoccia bacterium]
MKVSFIKRILFVFILTFVISTLGTILFLSLKKKNQAPDKNINPSNQGEQQLGQSGCGDLYKKYVPQNSPEKTYLLELDLLSKGMYCYDLSMFDPDWRKKGTEIIYSESYKNTAKKFSVPYRIYIEGNYAIIYFPNNKSEGPDFLYKDSSGWILDRTAVWDNIHYNYTNTGWFAYNGDYPYLNLLKEIYSLQRIELDNGVQAFVIAEN